MTEANLTLSDLERDTIQEILNIGIGTAAATLSSMMQAEVQLNIPRILLLKATDAENWLNNLGAGDITAVSQQFSGDFDGRALLLFPHQKSLLLVRALLREESSETALNDMEQEALLEVGNIILNSCFGTVANMLTLDVASALPQLHIRSDASDMIPGSAREDYLLIINMHFALKSQDLTGYLSFVMDIANLIRFKQNIQIYLQKHVFG